MYSLPSALQPGPIQNRGPLGPTVARQVPIYNMIQDQGGPMPIMHDMGGGSPVPQKKMPRQVRINEILDQLREAMLTARLMQLQKARENM